jgi:hypothetical protein
MTVDPTERPTPAQRTTKSYKKGKKRGRKLAGWMMAIGGGLVGTVYGVASGMKDVIVELLPEEEYDDDEEEAAPAPSAPAAGQQVPPFLHQQAP